MSAFSHFGSRLAMILGLAAVLTAARPALADLRPPLAVQWVQSLGAEPENKFAPLVMGDRVIANHDGKLYCFDALSGEKQWEAAIPDQRVTTAPLAWQDTVIFGLDNGALAAMKPTDKSITWQTDCGGYIAPSPILLDGLLMLGAQQTALALDPNTGHTKWACTLLSPARYGPLTDGAMLYFRCQDGSLQSVEAATGRFRWRVPVPFGPGSFPPVMAGGRIIVTAGDTLYAIARTGAQSWTAQLPVGVGGPIAVAGDTMFVPGVDGYLYTLYVRSGRAQRGAEYKAEGSATATPLVTDSLVILGTSGSLIYALDRATGAERWIYRCRAPEQFLDEASSFGLYAPLVTAGGALYALTGGGDLYSFTASAPDAAGPEFTAFKPESGDALGNGSVTVACEVWDDGSGVKRDSVTLTVDGKPLTTKFDLTSGMVMGLLSKPEDGSHLVKVTATDCRGNTASREWSFLTDESLTPKQPAQPGRPTPGGGRPTTGGTRAGQGGGR